MQCKKWSRARDTIEGQCVLLPISLRIKCFICFKQPKSLYESHFSRHTSDPLKNIVHIVEIGCKAAKKTKNGFKKKISQIHDVHVNSFFVFHPGA